MQAILIKAITQLEVYALLAIIESILKQGDIPQRNHWVYLLISATEWIRDDDGLYPFCHLLVSPTIDW